MDKDKFEFLSGYDPSKGGQLNESHNQFLLIGYVKDSDVEYAKGDYYVFVDTTYPETEDMNRWFENAVKIVPNEDGTGMSVYPNKNEIAKFVTLLPQYKNSYYSQAIFGLSDEIKKEKSKELFDTIETIKSGIALLKHNSEKKITDGYIRVGMQANSYSKSDFLSSNKPRAYFWGSKGGNDVSNFRTNYTYLCELPLDKIYDIQNNVNNLNISDVEGKGYTAIAYYINGANSADGTVVASFESLPIYRTIKYV